MRFLKNHAKLDRKERSPSRAFFGGELRTIEWVNDKNQVKLIDQRVLPRRFEHIYCKNSAEMIQAIQNMTIRGAPALAVAGAFGMVLAAREPAPELKDHLCTVADQLTNCRPTAVNLAWGIKRMLQIVNDPNVTDADLPGRLLQEAQDMADEDVKINQRLSANGASLIEDGDTIIHHCNTGSLAVVDWGTALGAIRYAHEQGKRVHVLVDETRPRLQGARLTAWECEQHGIPYEIITDNMAGYFLQRGEVQKVMFGADRVAANGDVVNKIGSYMLALAAHANGVPVYSVFPTSTLDLSIANGSLIPIEERDADEVLGLEFHGEPIAPEMAKARNPAFDVTPHHLLSALVTEKGIIYPPFDRNLPGCVYNMTLDG